MSLPTYDKSKRKKSFVSLPKDAYVLKIVNAKEVENKKNNGTHLAIAFDIAEGEYKGFYMEQFNANTSEDKKWPNDAIYRLTVPSDGAQQYVWDNWNTFFADLEDSNSGFVFSGECAALKNKLIGGKMLIEQSEYRGQVYDHTRLRWTCVADDVRNGSAAKNLPNDKLLSSGKGGRSAAADSNEFMSIPAGSEEEIPFD